MDLVRTFGIVINAQGAIAGGAQAAGAFKGVGTAAKDMERNTGRANNEFRNMRNESSGLASSLASLRTAIAGIGVIALARDLMQTQTELQRAANAMRYASGTAEEFARNQRFVRETSAALGQDLLSASSAFSKLAAAAKGTTMEGAGARNVFLATSEAAAALGLSADATSGALNAFQQMLSKGTVQAEELRGQLGERIPGAFNMAAKALGVTNEQLNKMLDLGKVAAADLLPAMAREMHKAFGPDAAKNANSLQAEMSKLSTAWIDFKDALFKDFAGDAIIGFLTGARDLLRDSAPLVKEIAAAVRGIGAYFGAGRGVMNESQPLVDLPMKLGWTDRPFASAPGWGAPASGAPAAKVLALEGAAADAPVVDTWRSTLLAEKAAATGTSIVNQALAEHADRLLGAKEAAEQLGFVARMFDGAKPFLFDKAAIDGTANGLQSYAETMGKVNSALSAFFGELDDESRINFDQFAKVNAGLDDFFSDLDEQSGTMTSQRSSRRGFREKQLMSGSWLKDMANSARLAGEDLRKPFENAKAAGLEMVDAVSGGMNSFFDGMIDGTGRTMAAFKQMTASILADIAKIVVRQSIANPIASFLLQGIGTIANAALFNPAGSSAGLGTSPGGFTGGYNGTMASTYGMGFGHHVGGFIGLTMGTPRLIDQSLFAFAPRLHSGLKPDEFPAILQRGEEVVPRERAGRTAAPIVFNNTIHVDGSKGGTPEQNQKFGAELARQVEASMRALIVKEMLPGGVLYSRS